MALNAPLLSAAIKTKVLSKNPQFADIADQMDYLFDAIAESVVEHIIAQAQVSVVVASVAGVTPGVGVSGPGTGTGTII